MYYNGYQFNFTTNDSNLVIQMTSSDVMKDDRTLRIPVKDNEDVRVKIRKHHLEAIGGADGVLEFINRCIQENFMMVWVTKIINAYCWE